jgi:glycosyltransferase involved in cell wall biosynthesis
MKKLSIITINKNNYSGLIHTIQSVISQSFKEFEYLIIDGGSADGSKEFIEQIGEHLTYWISEPDNGIFHAMNKGILKSTGEYCLFLNSGDWLVDENVVSDFCKQDFTEDIVAGSVFDAQNIDGHCPQPFADKLTYDFFVHDSLSHPATFIKRELFDRFGLYNENYKIVSDWEFFFKALILHNCSYAVFKRIITNFDHKGISWQSSFKELQDYEREQVLNELLPRVYPMHKELEELRAIRKEYDFLKSGHLGFIVRSLLKIKALKKQYGSERK